MTTAGDDRRFMMLAIRLAEKGRGRTSPNPMVGAVVVSNRRIVGRAYHRKAGQAHAEIHALREAGPRAEHATLYVSLEPCCHLKKRTPPCVPAILRSGVRRVVVAMVDPNPRVQGRGIAQLRRAGVAVTVGVGRSEAERVNYAYSHWIKTKRPYVVLKAGMTLDGRIATAGGESRWITSRLSRREVHGLRAEVDAVMVGIGTVLKDDPSLTARKPPALTRLASRQPLRIVVDSHLRIRSSAKILSQQRLAKTLVVTTAAAPGARRHAIARQGIEVLVLPAAKDRVSLRALLSELGRRGITSLMVEGGGELNAAFLKSRLVSAVRLYLAPRLLGGAESKGVVGGPSPLRLTQAWKLRNVRTRALGPDIVVEGEM